MHPKLSVRRAPVLAALALLLLVPHAVAAQNVLRLPGKTVEVVGLENWTVPMLQDSLRKYADGVTLDSHACAAALQQKLGFADAAVQRFLVAGQDEYVAVSVVEPADSARVRRRQVGLDTLTFRPGWEAAGTLVRRNARAMHGALQGDSRRSVPPFAAADSLEVRRLWAFFDARRTPEGYAAARRVLDSDPNVYDRILAAAVLTHAPADDATLHTLVRAMLDEADMVAQVASEPLLRMVRERGTMDWAPLAPQVHALLNGTGLYQLDNIIQALLASGVDGRWAAPFLAGGGNAVLARLDAENPRMSAPAHQLLVALRGEDLGTDSAPWRAWVASLGR
jgi:hypothetical protein